MNYFLIVSIKTTKGIFFSIDFLFQTDFYIFTSFVIRHLNTFYLIIFSLNFLPISLNSGQKKVQEKVPLVRL